MKLTNILTVALLGFASSAVCQHANASNGDTYLVHQSCPAALGEAFAAAKTALANLGFTQEIQFSCVNSDSSNEHAVHQAADLKVSLPLYLTRLFTPLADIRREYHQEGYDAIVAQLDESKNKVLTQAAKAVNWQIHNMNAITTIALYELSGNPIKAIRWQRPHSTTSTADVLPGITLYLPVIDELWWGDCSSDEFTRRAACADTDDTLVTMFSREIPTQSTVPPDRSRGYEGYTSKRSPPRTRR